jgi:cytoskeletal protein CcmA (bactofilin family)
MNNLRHQIGDAVPEQEDDNMNVPDIADERFPDPDFDERGQDAGGYSFGSYPAAPQLQDDEDVDDRALAVPEMPGVDSQISVVAQGTLWKGEVEADGSIHVFGRVEGTLTAKEDIWIAEGSDVQATVTARQVIVAGSVSGNIHALNRFEALPQGVVEADVQAPSFVVHEGATINGNLTMSSSDNGVSSGRAERAGSTPVIQRRIRPGS